MTLGPLMVDVAGPQLTAEDRELLRHPLVGSVILVTRNYVAVAQLRQLGADIKALRAPALLIGVDHEGGRVQRFRSGFSVLPPAARMGREFDLAPRQGLDLARRMGWLMAAELRVIGIDFSFAPCVDLDYGVSEIIGNRAFHAHSDAVGQLAVATLQGMREAGMAATAKHFPGHGAVVADSHLALPVDRRELPDLTADMAPYRRLIANDLAAVMMAHVLFPAIDTVPASFSRRWVGDILRADLGFKGVVFADDLSMAGAGAMGDVIARAEGAKTRLKPRCRYVPRSRRTTPVRPEPLSPSCSTGMLLPVFQALAVWVHTAWAMTLWPPAALSRAATSLMRRRVAGSSSPKRALRAPSLPPVSLSCRNSLPAAVVSSPAALPLLRNTIISTVYRLAAAGAVLAAPACDQALRAGSIAVAAPASNARPSSRRANETISALRGRRNELMAAF